MPDPVEEVEEGEFPPVPRGAPEKVTLDTAIMQIEGSKECLVQDFSFDWRHNLVHIRIGEPGDDGRSLGVIGYTGQEARDIMVFVNSANFSSKSLNTRIIERLQKDGHIGSGNISQFTF